MLNKVFTIFCVSAFAVICFMNMMGYQTYSNEINFSEMTVGIVESFVGLRDTIVGIIEWIQGLFTSFVPQ